MTTAPASPLEERYFKNAVSAGISGATAGCGGTIARTWQAGRSTFYCPVCQL